jgi:hypothetical protein
VVLEVILGAALRLSLLLGLRHVGDVQAGVVAALAQPSWVARVDDLLALVSDLDAHIVHGVEKGPGRRVRLKEILLVQENSVLILHFVHWQVVPLGDGLVQLVNNRVDKLLR